MHFTCKCILAVNLCVVVFITAYAYVLTVRYTQYALIDTVLTVRYTQSMLY